jgi:hypothetical protein
MKAEYRKPNITTVDPKAFDDLITHAAHGCHSTIGRVTQLLTAEEGHVLATTVIAYLIETASTTLKGERAAMIDIVMSNIERLLDREHDDA